MLGGPESLSSAFSSFMVLYTSIPASTLSDTNPLGGLMVMHACSPADSNNNNTTLFMAKPRLGIADHSIVETRDRLNCAVSHILLWLIIWLLVFYEIIYK